MARIYSSAVLLIACLVSSTSSFAPIQVRNNNVLSSSTSALAATVEKTSLVAPDSIPMDDVPSLFDEYVQKTYGRYPLTIVSGEGCTLTDSTGKTYLDFVAGISTCALGHSNAELAAAVTSQINTVHHVSNLYLIPSQGQLAAWLVLNSCADKAFFCNSGAEANEGAIKLARKYASNRGITDPVIITAHQSFHGRTLAALTATAQPKYHNGFGYGGKMVQGFEYVTYNNKEELEAMVKEMNTTPDDIAKEGRKRGVAAIMLEPLQGEGGIIKGDPEYFQFARKLCDEHDALLMCDEVQIGMGRSGKLWGYENLGVEPDVFTSAKALGGGVPIGAMCAKGEAANTLGPGDHASTYGGNPLACSAGLAVAQYYSDHDILGNVNARGEQLVAGLQKLAEKYPKVLDDVRGWGLLRGIKINDDAGMTAGELVGAGMKEGLLTVAAGPSVVRFVPPLIVTEAEIDQALDIFERTIVNLSS
jgi:acetylornithine/N-succinyldiaminopimelate aminotransferase